MNEEPSTALKIGVTIYSIVFWIGVLWWFRRQNLRNPDRPRSVPLGLMPIGYFLIRITPAIEYLNAKMALRNSERIRAFLQLADDLWMRKKRVDRRIPRGPGR